VEGHPMTRFMGTADVDKVRVVASHFCVARRRREERIDGLPSFFPAVSALSLPFYCLYTYPDPPLQSQKHIGDAYFLNSANNISFFFEPAAFAPDGSLNRPKEESVNKIGHLVALLDPVFRRFTFAEKVRELVRSLGRYQDPRVIQSSCVSLLSLSLPYFSMGLTGSLCSDHLQEPTSRWKSR
jgi:hypothetical protein